MDERLALAQHRYATGDYLSAFALCKEVLDAQPECVPGLILFSQLCLTAGHYVAAAQCLRLAELIDPQTVLAGDLRTEDIARHAYEEARNLDGSIEQHTDAFVFAAGIPEAMRIEALLREALAVQPDFAAAHASLGNLLGRTGNLAAALECYAAALVVDPQNAAVRLGYAERLRLTGEPAQAHEQFQRALKAQHTYAGISLPSQTLRAIALCAPDFWENNILVEMVIDRETAHLTKQYVGPELPTLVPHDVLISALADPHNAAAIAAAEKLVTESGARCLNAPSRLDRTARTYLSGCGLTHPHLIIPRTVRAHTASLMKELPLEFPFLLRPVASHRGEGLHLIQGAYDLEASIATSPGIEVFLTEYVDYRSSDGYYRKYRLIFVQGRPLAYHLAISPHWMVHYFSAPMETHAWMRDEEARFLEAPFQTFAAGPLDALTALARAVELDYFGLDCAIIADKVLVFEANTNMLVQDFYDTTLFAYKQPAFSQISQAFNAMIRESRSPG